jgi:hypothetical protein
MVGQGKNLWPDVHIDDGRSSRFTSRKQTSLTRKTVADLYLVLYDSIKTNPQGTGHGREGFYFGESGEHSLYQVGKAVSEALVAIGRGQSAEPTTFTQDETNKYFAVR